MSPEALLRHIEVASDARAPVTCVNAERTVLVTIHPNGSMSVALRDEAGDIWGPPIDVKREG